MNPPLIRALVVGIVSVSLAGLVAVMAGRYGEHWRGVPVLVICASWAFFVNWLVFIPAAVAKSDKYFDLTGSLTYLSTLFIAVNLVSHLDMRSKLIAFLVVVWAVRLGTFLFRRVSREGKDERFDQVKTNPLWFFSAWTLQGLWVFLTAACALTVISGSTYKPLGGFALLGSVVWLLGFSIEVISDWQKSRFRQRPENKGRFIQSGLWSWSRHPNYFGEIMLWCGIALIALPALHGWQYVALISPLFVFYLIYFVSGVNKLELKANKMWGSLPDYQLYKSRTSKLVLMPPWKG